MTTKPHKVLPLPSDITYEAVRNAVVKYAEQHGGKYWLSTRSVILLLNGWDGVSQFQNKSYGRACAKLQQAPGYTHHLTPTSGQSTAVRKQLDKLVEEKLVEKERGHTDGNNSWGYRWITDAMKAERARRKEIGAEAKDVARRLSLALGGDGESGVTPFITPDDGIGIRVNLYGTTAERILDVISMAGVSPDFFTNKHWEILTPSGEVMGCCADRADVRREEPDATFREVAIEKCRGCKGGLDT